MEEERKREYFRQWRKKQARGAEQAEQGGKGKIGVKSPAANWNDKVGDPSSLSTYYYILP